jgi:hypothetical protein
MRLNRLNAAVEETAPAFKGIPHRLDSRSIYRCMLSLGIKLPTDDLQKIAASGLKLDVRQIDDALKANNVGVAEALRFKWSLQQHGLLERGRRVTLPTVSADEQAVYGSPRWSDRFK